jgi:hypothetical protein
VSTRLVELAIQSLWNENRKGVVELLEPLLMSKNSRARLKALTYFVQKCSEEELAETMSAYSSATSPFYYDVVSWLDKILFAPPLCKRHSGNSSLKREYNPSIRNNGEYPHENREFWPPFSQIRHYSKKMASQQGMSFRILASGGIDKIRQNS